MKRVDRDLVSELLADGSLSYREIARRANCSDFSVRAISRELEAVGSTDASDTEPLTVTQWCVFGGIVILIFGGVWLLGRRLPPPDGAM